MSKVEDADSRVEWDCFSCGKHLGVQGDGGSFTLEFGYGSGLDGISGINGWICDECVAQKHGRLRVSNGAVGSNFWLETNQDKLSDRPDLSFIPSHDFFGRIPNGYGWRDYKSITAEERSRIESWLFNGKSIDADLVVKLLQALMESEKGRADADSLRWEAEHNAESRARQQAERLSAEELAQLRAREARSMTTAEDTRRVWEHAQWNENRFRGLQDRILELELENAALTERLPNRASDEQQRLNELRQRGLAGDEAATRTYLDMIAGRAESPASALNLKAEPARERDGELHADSAELTGDLGDAELRVSDKVCGGELRLDVDVEGHKGSVWMSRRMWEKIGNAGGWSRGPEATDA